MKKAKVVTGFPFHFHVATHRDDSSKITDRFQLGPGAALVFGDRHPDGMQAGEHDDSFFASSIGDPVKGGHFS